MKPTIDLRDANHYALVTRVQIYAMSLLVVLLGLVSAAVYVGHP